MINDKCISELKSYPVKEKMATCITCIHNFIHQSCFELQPLSTLQSYFNNSTLGILIIFVLN